MYKQCFKINVYFRKEYMHVIARYIIQYIIIVVTAWLLGGIMQLIICAATTRQLIQQNIYSPYTHSTSYYISTSIDYITSQNVTQYDSYSQVINQDLDFKKVQSSYDQTFCQIYGYKIGFNPDPIQALLGIIGVLILFVLFKFLLICKRCLISSKYHKSAGGSFLDIELDDRQDVTTIMLNDDSNDFEDNKTD